MKHYDYIFAGSGLSALMTVYRMVNSGKFHDKSILLIDSDSKKTNDRTWCFWGKPEGEWDKIVSKTWDSALFADENSKIRLDLSPFQYKMVKGIDFYAFINRRISTESNLSFLNRKIEGFSEYDNIVSVKTDIETFSCGKLFYSIFNSALVSGQQKYPFLQQHFVGWFIKSEEPAFNPLCATFMDFSVEQRGNTRFMYVLPLSETEALVEYTLFSEKLLPEKEYENAIEDYISKLGISNFKITEKEKGSIPMTVYPFWKHNTKNVIHIGSAGGWTKASTGYTFSNTSKLSRKLVSFLESENDFRKFHKTNRFGFYDMLLLDILAKKNRLGSKIFAALFKKGNAPLVFRFLNEETSLKEDLSVILKCPKGLFLNAFIGRILK